MYKAHYLLELEITVDFYKFISDILSTSDIFLSILYTLIHLILTISKRLGNLPNDTQHVNCRAGNLTKKSCSRVDTLSSFAANNGER